MRAGFVLSVQFAICWPLFAVIHVVKAVWTRNCWQYKTWLPSKGAVTVARGYNSGPEARQCVQGLEEEGEGHTEDLVAFVTACLATLTKAYKQASQNDQVSILLPCQLY